MFLSIYFDTTNNFRARQAVRIIAHTIKHFVRVLNCLIVLHAICQSYGNPICWILASLRQADKNGTTPPKAD